MDDGPASAEEVEAPAVTAAALLRPAAAVQQAALQGAPSEPAALGAVDTATEETEGGAGPSAAPASATVALGARPRQLPAALRGSFFTTILASLQPTTAPPSSAEPAQPQESAIIAELARLKDLDFTTAVASKEFASLLEAAQRSRSLTEVRAVAAALYGMLAEMEELRENDHELLAQMTALLEKPLFLAQQAKNTCQDNVNELLMVQEQAMHLVEQRQPIPPAYAAPEGGAAAMEEWPGLGEGSGGAASAVTQFSIDYSCAQGPTFSAAVAMWLQRITPYYDLPSLGPNALDSIMETAVLYVFEIRGCKASKIAEVDECDDGTFFMAMQLAEAYGGNANGVKAAASSISKQKIVRGRFTLSKAQLSEVATPDCSATADAFKGYLGTSGRILFFSYNAFEAAMKSLCGKLQPITSLEWRPRLWARALDCFTEGMTVEAFQDMLPLEDELANSAAVLPGLGGQQQDSASGAESGDVAEEGGGGEESQGAAPGIGGQHGGALPAVLPRAAVETEVGAAVEDEQPASAGGERQVKRVRRTLVIEDSE